MVDMNVMNQPQDKASLNTLLRKKAIFVSKCYLVLFLSYKKLFLVS